MDQSLVTKLKATLESPVYDDLVEFFNKQLRDLKNIDNVRELTDPLDQAVELKAQKKAYDKVEAIFNTIITIRDLPNAEDDQGNDFGLDESETK